MTYDAVPLIPRAVLFGNPERSTPAISPDGTRVGYVAPLDGVLNVWVGPLDDPSGAQPVTHDRGRGVRAYSFCHDDRTLVYLQDSDGDEDWRLYALELDSGEARLVTPSSGVQAQILGHNRWNRTTMLVGLNDRDPQLHDIWRLDLTTGGLDKVEDNPGYASWLIDSDLRVRGGVSMTEDGGALISLRDLDTRLDAPWRHIGPEDVTGTEVIAFPRDGSSMLLVSSINANAGRLVQLDLSTGAEQVLAADERHDIDDVVLDPDTLQPQSVVFAKDRDEWVHLDPAFGAEVDALRARLDGEIGISRSMRSGEVWLVSAAPSDGPVRWSAYDRSSAELRFLFAHKPALESYELAVMEPFAYTARDGLDVHGYLTFPPGVPRTSLPAVLDVHGGPWSRDSWGYSADAQWLANRGYLCVQVNYRGSLGYGKAFANAGDKEWGRAMHADLLDAVAYTVEQGWVDPARVGIMGGSYGGYAALAGAAFSSDVFRCAVDLVGPSNLLTLLASLPDYWQPQIAFMHARIGDPATERDMLWERSPLSHVDDIAIPLLIAQGANDPRVKQAESEQIVAALRDKGVPHEYLLFPDEGHGLARPENRERFYATAERFLAEHLGGRCED